MKNSDFTYDEKRMMGIIKTMKCRKCGSTWEAEMDAATLDSDFPLFLDEGDAWACGNGCGAAYIED